MKTHLLILSAVISTFAQAIDFNRDFGRNESCGPKEVTIYLLLTYEEKKFSPEQERKRREIYSARSEMELVQLGIDMLNFQQIRSTEQFLRPEHVKSPKALMDFYRRKEELAELIEDYAGDREGITLAQIHALQGTAQVLSQLSIKRAAFLHQLRQPEVVPLDLRCDSRLPKALLLEAAKRAGMPLAPVSMLPKLKASLGRLRELERKQLVPPGFRGMVQDLLMYENRTAPLSLEYFPDAAEIVRFTDQLERLLPLLET